MNRFEIVKDESQLHTSRPFYIRELGVRLPVMFSTFEAAERQAQMLALGPQPTRSEIIDIVALAARPEGDDELSRAASHYHP
jgi:hypothetical protein